MSARETLPPVPIQLVTRQRRYAIRPGDVLEGCDGERHVVESWQAHGTQPGCSATIYAVREGDRFSEPHSPEFFHLETAEALPSAIV